MKNHGKVALITGASRGIGRGIALKIAKEGYTIIINSRTADKSVLDKGAYEVKKKIEESGGKAFVFRADVSSAEERTAMVQFVDKEMGRLDLLVNNAGIEPPALDLLESDEERFDHVFSTNLKGPYFLTQQLAKRMLEWKKTNESLEPRIVFITSVQGHMSNPTGAEYCMTKAALYMASKIYAHRLAQYNIPVIEIRPGAILTDMSIKFKKNIDKMIEDKKILTPRWGFPEDIARLVSCIARGDLDYATGETIEVGGGLGISRLG
jgi:3-oxoacyl-[acyl-carrier protein] reductase